MSVPCRPEMLGILRSVAVTAAATHDVSIEVLEDLRLAVQEAGALIVASGSSRLEMTTDLADDGFRVSFSGDQVVAPWPAEGLQNTLAWQVLSALAEEVTFSIAGVAGVSIRKKLQ